MIRNSAGNEKAVAIKKVLSSGRKRAKDIVEACEERGIKESTVFYWLKELQKRNEIRKVRGKYGHDVYELIKLEEADPRKVKLLQKRFEDGNTNVRKAVAEDIRIICANEKVTHIEWIWTFLTNAIIGDLYDDRIKKKAITALRFVVLNSEKIGDEGAIEKIRKKYQEELEEIVLDRGLDSFYRNKAIEILDKTLPDEEFRKVSWSLLTELSKEKPFHPALHLWRRFLDRYFPERKLEILERLYPMVGDKDKSVREMASILLDTLRGRERGVT